MAIPYRPVQDNVEEKRIGRVCKGGYPTIYLPTEIDFSRAGRPSSEIYLPDWEISFMDITNQASLLSISISAICHGYIYTYKYSYIERSGPFHSPTKRFNILEPVLPCPVLSLSVQSPQTEALNRVPFRTENDNYSWASKHPSRPPLLISLRQPMHEPKHPRYASIVSQIRLAP